MAIIRNNTDRPAVHGVRAIAPVADRARIVEAPAVMRSCRRVKVTQPSE
jgi:hypothetical protein